MLEVDVVITQTAGWRAAAAGELMANTLPSDEDATAQLLTGWSQFMQKVSEGFMVVSKLCLRL